MDYFWKIPIRFSTIGFRLESSMNKVCYFLKRRNFYQLLHVSLFKKDTISFHSHLPVIRPVIWLVISPVIHQVICPVIRPVICRLSARCGPVADGFSKHIDHKCQNENENDIFEIATAIINIEI